MIRFIRVDGFRSLAPIELILEPGLNILIGPNGAGKTNIISFFRFLSELASTPSIGNAVSRTGGAGSIFQKVGDREFRSDLNATILGVINDVEGPNGSAIKHLYYKYQFRVNFSPERDFLYFSEQTLSFVSTRSPKDIHDISKNKLAWDFSIHQSVDNKLNAHVNLERFVSRKVRIDIGVRYKAEKSFKELILKRMLSDLTAEMSLFYIVPYYVWQLVTISHDLYSGEILNIDPAAVKRPEDGAEPPGIEHDGSGLAATLYHLQRLKERSTPHRKRPTPWGHARHVRGTSKTFDEIVSFLQLVNPAIAALHVTNDRFDNQLKVKLTIDVPGEDVTLPLSEMSDGTIKWLSLITAVLTYRSLFAIEEPENFLHPLMQKEVVNIMRKDAKRRFGQVIMSTHSETLLNAAQPDEVIVVSMNNGRTTAKRPDDTEELAQQIRDTGFGLGFYYVTGALSDA